MTRTQTPWWKDSTIYQIYPASFNDSNNDGMGDIPGITQSLDYIKSIGVDVIWVCPMYDSPQIDMGYDVSDYKSVYPPYGTVQDMEHLISEVHRRGMRIILDLVVNHTSDQHQWFKDSRVSKDSSKRDWYIWRPAKYDSQGNRKPPNNWRSNFGGPAWSWDEQTQEYYLHLFCPEQPDLNWECEEARNTIYQDAMIFWLDLGCDGFRIDTVNMYSKPEGLPDAPITDVNADIQEAGLVYCNGPYMNQYLEEMNAILSRYDAMSVGECPFTPQRETVVGYVSAEQKRLNMVFQFDCVDIGQGKVFKFQTTPFNYKLTDLKKAVNTTQGLIKGTDAWTTSFIENHDQARCVSRFGDDSPQWRVRSGKMLSTLFASLSGTLFVYQGQEIGMINIPEDWSIDEYKDVDSSNYYKMVAKRDNNDPASLKAAKTAIQHVARDHARTPMQWDATKNGGFTSEEAEPWMRVNTSTKDINVQSQTAAKDSVLAYWRRMLQTRKEYKDVLVHGQFELVDAENQTVFSFVKKGTDRQALVVCNFSGSQTELPQYEGLGKRQLVMSNVEQAGDALEPWESRIYIVQ